MAADRLQVELEFGRDLPLRGCTAAGKGVGVHIAAAVAIPIAILVLFAWLIFKLFTPRRKETSGGKPSSDEPTKELIDA